MKVELKLKADDINYLALLFESFGNVNIQSFVNMDRQQKLIMSILVELSDKFSDKIKKLSRKTTLFDTNKTHKISLKFYEAHAMAVYLRGAELNETDTYRKTIAIKLLITLDAKLT